MIRSFVSALVLVLLTLVGVVCALTSRLFDRSGDTVMHLARIWSRLFLAVAGVRVKVRMAAPLDPGRPYVVMANHASALDIWALYVALPIPVRMIAKKQLGYIPIFGWAMHAGRFVFIDRQNATSARRSIDEATRRIQEGTTVLIFPEGTRSRDGSMAPFKKGGFYLAMNSGAPIIPVAIRGARELLPPGHLLVRSGEVEIDVGAPIATEGLTERDRNPLLERVEGIVREMAGQPPLASPESVMR